MSDQPQNKKTSLRGEVLICFLFSGPAERKEGFADWVLQLGKENYPEIAFHVREWDIVNGADLADQIAWEAVLREIRSHGDAVLASPPCGTFFSCPVR